MWKSGRFNHRNMARRGRSWSTSTCGVSTYKQFWKITIIFCWKLSNLSRYLKIWHLLSRIKWSLPTPDPDVTAMSSDIWRQNDHCDYGGRYCSFFCDAMKLRQSSWEWVITSFVQIINILLNFIKDLVRLLHGTADKHLDWIFLIKLYQRPCESRVLPTSFNIYKKWQESKTIQIN